MIAVWMDEFVMTSLCCGLISLTLINSLLFNGYRYLFGKEVNGMAYVVFGVMKDGRKSGLPSSLQRVPVSDKQ